MRFAIPYLDELDAMGVEDFLSKNHTDFAIFAARWYYAAKKGGVPVVPLEDCPRDGPVLVSDYFCFDPNFPDLPPNCLFYSAWAKYIERAATVAGNAYVVNHLQPFDPQKMYYHTVLDVINAPGMVVVPLGGMQDYLQPAPFAKTAMIFLDEPHRFTLGEKDHTLQHVFSYMKAVRICQILEQRGFKIITFCSHGDPHLPFKTLSTSRMPYFQLIEGYKSASLFFCHHQETHGYSVYENLQLGHPVITFAENFNILTTRQFQNGVVLSLYFSDQLCADMIVEFWNTYNEGRSRQIAQESYAQYSADTFAERLARGLRKLECYSTT